MPAKETVIAAVVAAFGDTPYPGDPFLQGSWDGCEPEEEVGPFRGKTDWQILQPDWLDGRGTALSFFSEAAFRFFLPAYLVADVRDQLERADPLFHLTWAFHQISVEVPAQGRVFVRKTGDGTLLNPRRYGAIRQRDYGCYRLSVFCREEARAIVLYLEQKRDTDAEGLVRPQIDAALEKFWNRRAARAPRAVQLQQHVKDERDFVSALGGGEDQSRPSGGD